MIDAIESEMKRIISILVNDQTNDGSWGYPFETGIATDAYMIILLRTFEINDELLIQALVRRIMKCQEPNGAWKLFYDEEGGDLSSTLQAYYSLLYSGYVDKNHPRLLDAKQFILSKGGIDQGGTFTKILLALTGHYSWKSLFPIPVELILLPTNSSFNFYDFSVFGRANLAPILILSHYQYQKRTNNSPDLSDLFTKSTTLTPSDDRSGEWRNLMNSMIHPLRGHSDFQSKNKEKAVIEAYQYMMKRIETDGTLLSYFSATFLMIFAFKALGFPNQDPKILKAIEGLKNMACRIDGDIHMQYTTANVWNTALISHVLQDAGISVSSCVIQRANRYLLSRQHTKYGDWSFRNPGTPPGGWGFSDINTINPDVDDSTASLRSICEMATQQPMYKHAWARGTKWVLSMQNDNGGWPAFEREVDKKWLALAPIQGAEYLLLDPSSADLTGRTLEFFGNYTTINKKYPMIEKGVNWLQSQQNEDGSWYGRWGICYIYGTWAALTGLAAVSNSITASTVEKAVDWLHSIQKDDGGWGESCRSDIIRRYVPLAESTLTHTAWAVDALVAISDVRTPEIDKGILYLIHNGDNDDWTTRYPKGQGMAGGFYIHYHSYRYIWPLMALSNYRRKFLGGE